MEDGLNCDICCELFADDPPARQPLILRECGHTLCRGCIENLLSEAAVSPAGGRVIACPFRCSQKTVVEHGAASLARNWTVQTLAMSKAPAALATGLAAVPASAIPGPAPGPAPGAARPPGPAPGPTSGVVRPPGPALGAAPVAVRPPGPPGGATRPPGPALGPARPPGPAPGSVRPPGPTPGVVRPPGPTPGVVRPPGPALGPARPPGPTPGLGTAPPPHVQTPANGTYKIQCVANERFLDIDCGSTEPGTRLIHYDARDRPNQKFRVERNPAPNTFTLTAMHSNLVLDVDRGDHADGTPLIQWPARPGRTNQQFRIEPVGAGGPGEHSIIAVHSGMAVDAGAPDLSVCQRTPNQGPSQRFRFLPA